LLKELPEDGEKEVIQREIMSLNKALEVFNNRNFT
jgi:hypothetical protein